MAKDPAVLFYISDWLTSTSEMDSDCKGWYLNLILHNYDKGSLPNDFEKLAVLANVKFSEYQRFEQVFEQVLKHKFEQTENNRLTNLKTQTILKSRELFKEKRSESGKLSYFLKFCRNNQGKHMTEDFEKFIKDNIIISDLDTKNKQVLEQVFEHLFELYRNENENENEDENEDEIVIVIEYLNKMCNKNFKVGTEANKKVIRARLKDGFTVEDLKTVIDKKAHDWKGTENDLYLRPETLFRPSKFEGYLNQQVSTKPRSKFEKLHDANEDFMDGISKTIDEKKQLR